jgi:multimeric flavodoxin WrbA
LTPVLEKIENADAVILGSPIYLGNVTGEMRSLMERMIFQYLVYDENHSSLFENKKPIGFIYTMGATEGMAKEWEYDRLFTENENISKRIFGASETLFATDTYQFNDYSKYVATAFNEADKAKRRQEVFPQDCKKAFNLGIKFATKKVSEFHAGKPAAQ